MNTTLAIAKREFRTFFASPIAYIVLAVFLSLSGWLFFGPLFLAGQASLRGFFGLVPLLFVFIVPAITMRALAEERKSGTIELLLTFPIEDWEIVAGKFLASLGMIAVGLLFTLPYSISVAALTGPGPAFDWGAAFSGYLGLLLVAASFIALGLWGSAASRNQIVGFIIGLVLCIFFAFIDNFALLLPERLARIVEYVSVDFHFQNIARGVIDTRDLIFYATLIAIGLTLTTSTLSSARK
ncbi:MAG: ABC transporter permease subunit [Archangium sp.]|nr:ABC transporter permease subunit [Archangium sp.]